MGAGKAVLFALFLTCFAAVFVSGFTVPQGEDYFPEVKYEHYLDFLVNGPKKEEMVPALKVDEPKMEEMIPDLKVAEPKMEEMVPDLKVDEPKREEEHPDTKTAYHFDYQVNDPKTGDVKSHSEVRDGDSVRGSYSVLGSDGKYRTLRYKSDAKTGFVADLEEEKLL